LLLEQVAVIAGKLRIADGLRIIVGMRVTVGLGIAVDLGIADRRSRKGCGLIVGW
jgi:hypothetical protein